MTTVSISFDSDEMEDLEAVLGVLVCVLNASAFTHSFTSTLLCLWQSDRWKLPITIDNVREIKVLVDQMEAYRDKLLADHIRNDDK